MGMAVRLLIVDDETHVRTSLAGWFRDEGFSVETASDGREALDSLSKRGADILLLDIKMPGMDGIEVLQRARKLRSEATVIMMTAHASVDTAVQALKDGAYDYITKPFDPEDLSRLVHKAAERYKLLSENRALKARLAAAEPQLIHDPKGPMAEVLAQVDQVAATDTSVLVGGESGTGKEIVAKLIHGRSDRRFGPLVMVNCAALAEGVLESELFGHERGAFTGAAGRRRGKLELAHEGTLFLDEVGDIPLNVQVDLLRVLQEHQLTRVGGNESVAVDFRLICATHCDLDQAMQAGRVRQDFYFRINVFRIEIPPLRERPMDIPGLAQHFLEIFNERMNRRVERISSAALDALLQHRWPGNVRELQNCLERAVVLCNDRELGTEHLAFLGGPPPEAEPDQSLAAMESAHIRRVLASCGFNISQAARSLAIDRVTLYNKIKKYHIERP